MNFNAEELAALVSSDNFTIEGHLLMYKVHKKKKKQAANWSERWFGLRNNILFCMKGTTKMSGCSAVIILEHCCIELDSEDEQSENYVFFIRQAGSDENIYLAAKTESERTEWVTRLHEASYENMRMQLDLLREQVLSKTGHDPITLPIPQRQAPDQSTQSEYLDLQISCHLHHREEEKAPNISLEILVSQPPVDAWRHITRTETVYNNFEAEFTPTLFLEGDHRSKTLKIIIDKDYDDNNNEKCNGKVEFKLGDLIIHEKMILNIRSLDLSADGAEGRVEIMRTGLKRTPTNNEQTMNNRKKEFIDNKRRQLKFLFNEATMIHYLKERIPTSISVPSDRTTPNHSLTLLEIMAESNISFKFSLAYLQILMDDTIYQANHLNQLTEVNDSMSARRTHVLSQLTELRNYLHSQIKSLQKHIPTRTFKRSTEKGLPELENIPTNLHINRLIVSESDFMETKECYDIITVGAFTAYTHGYKKGGLLAKLKSLNFSEISDNLLSSGHKPEFISQLHELTALHRRCSELSTSIQNVISDITKNKEDPSKLNHLLQQLAEHKRLLISLFCHPELSCYVAGLGDVTSDVSHSVKTYSWSAGKEETIASLDKILNNHQEGTTVRDIDVMHCGSCVNKLFKYLCDILSYTVIDYRLSPYHRDLLLQKRFIIVVNQAVTSAVTGIISTLRCRINDSFFLNQISKIGLLLHFESLLSCYKSEEAMMEDFYVGIWYLQGITFKLQENNSDEPRFLSPMCIEISLPSSIYSLLPADLQTAGFNIVTTLFNIGINEQAMLASWRDKLELQENINFDSFIRLEKYFYCYKSLVNKENTTPEHHEKMTLIRDMLAALQQKLDDSKKSPDILKISMQICRALNGVRFTSCKSAKDRTGMSVTLEESFILQEQHAISPTYFKTLLTDLRSDGVRRENIRKNIGSNHYAFSSIQLKTFPDLYRPPNGTYGATET